ncbi:glycerol-3-phosphate dehydrogenase [NAD(+)], chloroplastic isoform X3 [Phoenix dactylifera]|uniref:Glycerol-3-phosphate dehydrogenase [NAD(+)] n=1 Tax=Phoenix dactylifera TaxID=42345 RepID=A0A8B8J5W4_PHODC|nr:glycerol-3-phosphate dehydrogenase [NAD(+)], chloroplastic isoform X3 [Phoenix dactylifera]
MAALIAEPSLVAPLFPSSGAPRRNLSPSGGNLGFRLKPFPLSVVSPPLPPACPCSAGTLDPDPAEERPTSNSSTKVGGRKGGRDRRRAVRIAWEKLVRWSRSWRSKAKSDILERTKKVVVLGGGSFGTAMAAHVASKKAEMEVAMLVRDVDVCRAINESHFNSKYFPEHKLPENIIATTNAKDALLGADFCLHAVPVQFSSSFLEGISQHVGPNLPFISLSKGLELNTLRMMSQIIPHALGNPRQPFIVLSGPSFAVELMKKLPTAMVVASKDKKLASAIQQLLASPHLRISSSSDVTGVEIAGALKNVLAIAAGIVEGMNLGNNCMAALVAQGCSEIRWLATKVAEGVSTAGAVIALAQKYHVKMPVLTAVARIIDNELTPKKAVLELMSLPQVEEV